MFKNGCRKAVTFSYDDGCTQDARLVGLFNRYGLKGTFNLNAGLVGDGNSWEYKGKPVARLGWDEVRKVYTGHEIAAHGYTHPYLERLGPISLHYELAADKARLEEMLGITVVGMAYPFGTYSDAVVQEAAACGLRYARTVQTTGGFAMPQNTMALLATGHHDDAGILGLAAEFLAAQPEEDMLFYIWGHAYEFDGNGNWAHMERLCETLAGHRDVFYGTNAEVLGFA